jgi:hypothetical protein
VAELALGNFISEVRRFTNVKKDIKYYFPQKDDLKIIVSLFEKNFDQPNSDKIIESALIEALKNDGFNLLPREILPKYLHQDELLNINNDEIKKNLSTICDFLIVGRIETKEKGEAFGLFFAESWGELKVLDVKRGSIFTSFSVVPTSQNKAVGFDTKGGGASKILAGLNSLKKSAALLNPKVVKIMNDGFSKSFKIE